MAVFEVVTRDGREPADTARVLRSERLEIPGRTFRKLGLGKDVTDKFLGGLPAYRRKAATASSRRRGGSCIACRAHTRTVCLEFFGQARDAIPAIVEIRDYLARHGAARGVLLAGLEHLDERYLKAVGYTTKSKRGALPKMVLIGDIVGADEDAVAH